MICVFPLHLSCHLFFFSHSPPAWWGCQREHQSNVLTWVKIEFANNSFFLLVRWCWVGEKTWENVRDKDFLCVFVCHSFLISLTATYKSSKQKKWRIKPPSNFIHPREKGCIFFVFSSWFSSCLTMTMGHRRRRSRSSRRLWISGLPKVPSVFSVAITTR